MEKKLLRSRNDRMIAGVCGGLADYVALDPTLVRVGVVLLAVASQGAIVIAYFVMAIVVPEEPLGDTVSAWDTPTPTAPTYQGGAAVSDEQTTGTTVPENTGFEAPQSAEYQSPVPPAAQWTPTPVQAPESKRRGRGGVGFGIVLVLVGVLLLVNEFVPGVDVWRFWPLLIVAAGLSAVFKGVRR